METKNKNFNEFWEDNLIEINKIIKQVFYKEKSSMEYLGIDLEEFQSLANLILVQNLKYMFDDCYRKINGDTIVGLMYTILDRKTKTYIRDQNRHKRKINLRTRHWDEPVGTSGQTLGDVTPDKSNYDNGDNNSDGLYCYLKSLSEKQKIIIILKCLGCSDLEICETMRISKQRYNDMFSSLKTVERRELLSGKRLEEIL